MFFFCVFPVLFLGYSGFSVCYFKGCTYTFFENIYLYMYIVYLLGSIHIRCIVCILFLLIYIRYIYNV